MILAPIKHGAEWRLHRELVINDLMMDRERAKHPAAPAQGTRKVVLFMDATDEVTPGAQAAVLWRIREAGLRGDAAREVLEALGLLDVTRTPKKRLRRPPQQPRRRTTCHRCLRVVEVVADGTKLTAHSRQAGRSSAVNPCPGGGEQPCTEVAA
jgi:hypothetical protein